RRPQPAGDVAYWLANALGRVGEGPEPECRRIYPNCRKYLELTRETAIYTKLPANRRNWPSWLSFASGGTMRSVAVRSNLLVPEVREVMDIRQASDYLGISPDTLYKYASEDFVPAFKLGNRWRFKRSRLDEWMDQQSSQGAQPRKAEPQPDVAQPRKPQSVVPRPKRAVGASR